VQFAILSEIAILEKEFNKMLQKQTEMAGVLSRINRHEGKLSKQVTFLTEEFSKMEDKTKEVEKMVIIVSVNFLIIFRTNVANCEREWTFSMTDSTKKL
jgi:hypothetical protein